MFIRKTKFLCKILIVDTRRCLSKAILKSTYNLCFGAKIKKNVFPCKLQFYYIKVGLREFTLTKHVIPMCFKYLHPIVALILIS